MVTGSLGVCRDDPAVCYLLARPADQQTKFMPGFSSCGQSRSSVASRLTGPNYNTDVYVRLYICAHSLNTASNALKSWNELNAQIERAATARYSTRGVAQGSSEVPGRRDPPVWVVQAFRVRCTVAPLFDTDLFFPAAAQDVQRTIIQAADELLPTVRQCSVVARYCPIGSVSCADHLP